MELDVLIETIATLEKLREEQRAKQRKLTARSQKHRAKGEALEEAANALNKANLVYGEKIGDLLGTFIASEPDVGESLALSGSDANAFAINLPGGTLWMLDIHGIVLLVEEEI